MPFKLFNGCYARSQAGEKLGPFTMCEGSELAFCPQHWYTYWSDGRTPGATGPHVAVAFWENESDPFWPGEWEDATP